MKLRWLVVGTIAAVVGGVLVVKHFTENKDKNIRFAENDNEVNFQKYSADINESEFEGTEFLI